MALAKIEKKNRRKLAVGELSLQHMCFSSRSFVALCCCSSVEDLIYMDSVIFTGVSVCDGNQYIRYVSFLDL